MDISGHLFPGEDDPVQSPGDRTALRVIGQKRRTVVSGRTEKMKGFEDQPDQMSMVRRATGSISTTIRHAIVFAFGFD